MGFARTCSVALVGVEGVVVEVQADLEPGVAAFTLVGLPDKSLIESRERVRAAVVNSGTEWPQKKLTVGLSPASVPKGGSGFDLAVACAVLGAAERLDPRELTDLMMIGELGLDGRVRPVRGVLPAVLAAADAGYRQVVVPEQTAAEASLVPGVSVLGVRSLRQLIAVLADEPVPDEEDPCEEGRPDPLLAGLVMPGTGIGAGLPAGDHAPISRTSPASRAPAAPWRWPPPDATTSSSKARPAPAKPCSPNASPGCCHGCPPRNPWRSPPSIRWPAPSRRDSRSSIGRLTVPRTTPRRWHPSWAAAPDCRAPEPSPWPITACCSWTRPPNAAHVSLTRCASHWNPAMSSSPGRRA